MFKLFNDEKLMSQINKDYERVEKIANDTGKSINEVNKEELQKILSNMNNTINASIKEMEEIKKRKDREKYDLMEIDEKIVNEYVAMRVRKKSFPISERRKIAS
jgi:predicted solute-binding protein